MATWMGQPHIKGSTEQMRMALLTFSLIGLQFTWGFEMTYCTPYLLQLGLTKSRTSLVWIAGPLSGLVMQPIVGVISDRSTSRYGRRRPFMVLGSVVVAACLLVLGWTREIVGLFVAEGDFQKSCTVFVAVLSIYAVDFAINAVQSCCRSLIVDTLPIPKQQLGSAWASRMVSVGSLLGYFIGTLDLVTLFGPSFGDTQFKKLTVLAAFMLIFAVGVTSWAVTERVLAPSAVSIPEDGILKIVRQIIHTTANLPPRIQAICNIQLWSWIGWFPFLFYSTTFVGEIYFRFDAPHDVKQSKDALGDIGRIGSLSLVVFSIVTFAGAFILPLLIRSPEEEAAGEGQQNFTPRPPAAIAGAVTRLHRECSRPDLLTAWTWGLWLFAGAMLLAPFAHSFRFATVLVALCGLPWALACWAPGTFLGIEVNKMSSGSGGGGGQEPAYHRLPGQDSSNQTPDLELSTRLPPSSLQDLERATGAVDAAASSPATTGAGLSGLYFGILNIYSTIPQFIGTFISMIVFGLLEPGKSPELAHDADPSEHHGTGGPNAIAVCLFIGALCTIGAAFATRRLRALMETG